jgi:drug/metabolite transporter (DMT)-like permease
LTRLQWLSLLLLTSGCIIKQFEHSSIKISDITTTISQSTDQTPLKISSLINIHLIWILIQVFCSCFAGVYNEYLLKSDRTNQVDMMLQNAFMYFDSILCNIILLIYFDYQQPTLLAIDKFYNILQLILSGKEILILFIILNNAAVGIVTSLFLKSMTSILKTFASALELLFTSILAWMLFSIPVSIYTFIAIIIVSTAVYLYSINPVVNLPKTLDINTANNNDINLKNIEIGANEQGPAVSKD